MRPEITQTKISLTHPRKILYAILALVLVGGIVFLFIFLRKDKPLTQRQVEKAFREMAAVPVETTMTEEEVAASFKEMEAVPVEKTMTEEEVKTAFEKMQEQQ